MLAQTYALSPQESQTKYSVWSPPPSPSPPTLFHWPQKAKPTFSPLPQWFSTLRLKARNKWTKVDSSLFLLPSSHFPPQCTFNFPRATPCPPSTSQPPLIWLYLQEHWLLEFFAFRNEQWESIGNWQTKSMASGLLRPWAGDTVPSQPRGFRNMRIVQYSFIHSTKIYPSLAICQALTTLHR